MKNNIPFLFILLLFSCFNQKQKNGARTDINTSDSTTHRHTDAAESNEPSVTADTGFSNSLKDTILASGAYAVPTVNVIRHLVSDDDHPAYLNIYTGVYNTTGYYIVDYKTDNEEFVHFDGFQKGKTILFTGYNPEKYYLPLYHFEGLLDLENGSIDGKWRITNDNDGEEKSISFQPVYKVTYPKFKFKTFTTEIDHELYVSKIKVLDENNNEIQILDGFIAHPVSNDIILEDLNFDGYFDLRIWKDASVASDRKDVQLCWLYNAETKQFEYNEYLNNMEISVRKVDCNKQITEVTKRGSDYLAVFYELGFKNGKFILYKVE